MPFSKRSVPFETVLLGEILLGAFLLSLAVPARAGNDDDDEDEFEGRISTGQFLEDLDDQAKNRSQFFFGDHSSPDPVLGRGGFRGDRYGNFDDPERARQAVAEDLLDRLEDRLNEKSKDWNPFRKDEDDARVAEPERKREREREEPPRSPDPALLFGLEDADPPPAFVSGESWKSRFRLTLSRGLEYKQEWPTEGDRKLQMRIYGPVVPGGPGLGLQLRGHVLDRRFRLNAYGAEKEFGLAFDVEF